MSMPGQLQLPTLPVRLCVAASIPGDPNVPTRITVTLDPPSDRYELVWYQDTMTEKLTPEEASDAVSLMVIEALKYLPFGDGPLSLFTPELPGQPFTV